MRTLRNLLGSIGLAAVLSTLLALSAAGATAAAPDPGASPDGATTLTVEPFVDVESGQTLRIATTGEPLAAEPGAAAFSLQCGFMMRAAREFVCGPAHGTVEVDFDGHYVGTIEARRAFPVGDEIVECDVTVKCIVVVLVVSSTWEILEGATEILHFAPAGTPSAGCASPLPTGTSSPEIVTADGRTRSYQIQVPVSAAGSPAALVLNFHGYTSDIEGQLALSGLAPFAEEQGFILVTPQGEPDARGVNHWNLNPTGGVVDDVAFVDQLLDELEQNHCVDTDRVFSTGMSNGGFFSGALACRRSDRIAAIAGVTGLSRSADCNTQRTVPLLYMHGTADAVVPFAAMASNVASWAEDLGCAPEPSLRSIGDDVEHRSYQGCRGPGVEFYVVDGGGHTWPSSPIAEFVELILGYTTFDISANELMWDWFRANPLR